MDFYNHRKVGDHSYLITEVFRGETRGHSMGLFVGNTRACIVDTSWGVVGNLRKYISQITALPVICLLTHPHPDHAGASVLFDEIYMNPLDEPIVEWALTRERRLQDAGRRHQNDKELLVAMEREMTDCSKFSYRCMNDGDVFDLGGITIEAISVPGHTSGSMALYCKEDDILCVGDAIGPNVSLLAEGEEKPFSVSEYQATLARLCKKITPNTKLVAGHSLDLLGAQTIRALLTACDNAISGNHTPPDPDMPLPAFVKNVNVPVSIECVNETLLIYTKL